MENSKLKFIGTGFFCIAVIIVSCILFFYFGIMSSDNNNKEKIDFTIKPGQSITAISKDLYKNGIIKNKFFFKTYLWLKGLETKVKAGQYNLSKNLNIKELVRVLSTGTVKKNIKIKIIEGWTNEDIANYLDTNDIVKKDDFINLSTDSAKFLTDNLKTYSFLSEILIRNNNQSKINLEGYLFPDTYKIHTKSTSEDIIKKMLDNFKLKINDEILNEIKKQNKSIDEILILASIVEKEVATYEDRRMVADIFLKRLKIGMPLQSDATINYITKKGTTRPSYDDLKIQSKYNTYQNKGLPPGPINNPSLSAIQAVVYPLSNNFYFFLTDKDGGIHFGRNGEEHILNRQKYLE